MELSYRSDTLHISWGPVSGSKTTVRTSATSRLFPNLNPNTEYAFVIKSVNINTNINSGGVRVQERTFSNVPTSAPGAVQGVNVTQSGNVITLQWNSTNDAESYDIEYRRIDGTGIRAWGTRNRTTTRWAIEVDDGSVIVFRVRAKNSVGSGPWSDLVSNSSDTVLAVPQDISVVVQF